MANRYETFLMSSDAYEKRDTNEYAKKLKELGWEVIDEMRIPGEGGFHARAWKKLLI